MNELVEAEGDQPVYTLAGGSTVGTTSVPSMSLNLVDGCRLSAWMYHVRKGVYFVEPHHTRRTTDDFLPAWSQFGIFYPEGE